MQQTSGNIGSIFHLFRNYAWKKPVTKRRSQNAHNKRNVSIKLRKLRLGKIAGDKLAQIKDGFSLIMR